MSEAQAHVSVHYTILPPGGQGVPKWGALLGVLNIVLPLLGGSLVPRTHPFLREGRGQLSSRAETLSFIQTEARVKEGQKVWKESKSVVLISPGPQDRLQNSLSEAFHNGYQVKGQALDLRVEGGSHDSLSRAYCLQSLL